MSGTVERISRNRLAFKYTAFSVAIGVVAWMLTACVGATAIIPGDVYVSAGREQGMILDFSPSGKKTVFASGLNYPSGLAFDGDGNLYEADSQSDSIIKFSTTGERTTFASGLNNPNGLAFDSVGNLYESDTGHGSGQINKFTPAGVKSTFATALIPSGLAFDSKGTLYAADQSLTVYKFTPAGRKSAYAVGYPGIAFDANDNLYSTSSPGSIIVAPHGDISVFASGLFDPIGLTFDARGNLFVVDSDFGIGMGNSSIYAYTPAGVRSTFASGLTDAAYIAFALVPEPSLLFPTCTAFWAGLALVRRRQRNNPAS